jgi:hypothetical protein
VAGGSPKIKTLYRYVVLGMLRKRSRSIRWSDHGIPFYNQTDLRFRGAVFPKPIGHKVDAIRQRREIKAHNRPGNPWKRSKGSKTLRYLCSFSYGIKPHFSRNLLVCQNKKFYVPISFVYRRAEEVLHRDLPIPRADHRWLVSIMVHYQYKRATVLVLLVLRWSSSSI